MFSLATQAQKLQTCAKHRLRQCEALFSMAATVVHVQKMPPLRERLTTSSAVRVEGKTTKAQCARAEPACAPSNAATTCCFKLCSCTSASAILGSRRAPGHASCFACNRPCSHDHGQALIARSHRGDRQWNRRSVQLEASLQQTDSSHQQQHIEQSWHA